MRQYSSCYEFTEKGCRSFEKVFLNELADSQVDLSDVSIAKPISDTQELLVKRCETSKELAQSVIDSIGAGRVYELLECSGLWSWLTFVFRCQLFSRQSDGRWKVGEVYRWCPSDPNDWRKSQRHLIRMPVQLLSTFGDDADHLICGKPSVLPDIREQLTSQQDMFDRTFQQVARSLYFDPKNKKVKRGASGKGQGSSRRLAQVRRQFDVTWDLEELDVSMIMDMLPSEFDRFK